jgi:hypothetical protein
MDASVYISPLNKVSEIDAQRILVSPHISCTKLEILIKFGFGGRHFRKFCTS